MRFLRRLASFGTRTGYRGQRGLPFPQRPRPATKGAEEHLDGLEEDGQVKGKGREGKGMAEPRKRKPHKARQRPDGPRRILCRVKINFGRFSQPQNRATTQSIPSTMISQHPLSLGWQLKVLVCFPMVSRPACLSGHSLADALFSYCRATTNVLLNASSRAPLLPCPCRDNGQTTAAAFDRPFSRASLALAWQAY